MKRNFWLRGRENQQRFYQLKIRIKTNLLGTLLALLTAAILVLPLALMIIQFLLVYGFSRRFFYLYLVIVWLGLLFFNGLVNYLIVIYSKSLERENSELQQIEAKFVFYYQCFNFVFAVVALIGIVFFAFQIFGGYR
ncbi:MAG: hypothetical protein GX661_05400 [Acholeplasmataceae bacterium]|nr:hypothetical protein [Acholeplasmataceae bacterium]